MQKSDTKRHLVDAVKELLHSGEDFTVKDISQRAYTNVAAVNYYFGDKNTLVNIALQELIDVYREKIIETLRQDMPSTNEYIESFLTLVSQMYLDNKGVIRYIVRTDTGNKPELIESFLFDDELTRLVYEKMELMTGEKRPEVQFCNYMIALSSFILPLLFECQNDDDKSSGFGLIALQSEDMRRVFVTQLMKLFT
ncbi:MAG: TetR/AcrR family transcriptional regulator [Clostridiales bacterium]|jgi:AcrR family transcriptional regulator|nr:TetR/AcrR family transcriptional regulator [Clostridiales bacterium]